VNIIWTFRFTGSGIFVSPGRGISSSNEDEGVDSAFALGELAQLTVNNDVENSYDVGFTSFSFLENRLPLCLDLSTFFRWLPLRNRTEKLGVLNIHYVVISMAFER
jgi:hypothetical protein